MPTNKHNSPDLKKAGLKVTLPRVKILHLLEQAPHRHASAEDIYRSLKAQGEEIGLATVYRVLTQFEAAELVIRHTFSEGHAVFELNPEEHHDHLICTHCGRIEEFVDEAIEHRQREIATAHGFNMIDHNLSLYGICRDCQR